MNKFPYPTRSGDADIKPAPAPATTNDKPTNHEDHDRDVKRSLKRSIARKLFKLLERHDQPDVEIIRAA
jgi:hypothetical protein